MAPTTTHVKIARAIFKKKLNNFRKHGWSQLMSTTQRRENVDLSYDDFIQLTNKIESNHKKKSLSKM